MEPIQEITTDPNDKTIVEIPEIKQDDKKDYKYTNIDQLDEDPIIDNQQWGLFSFISPEGIMNCNVRGLKFRGAYKTYEEAQKKATALRKRDPYFDIFVGQVGKWLPFDASTEKIEEVKYGNKKLEHLMKNVQPKDDKQTSDTNTLNELIGRKKEEIDKSKTEHKDRMKSMIKEGSAQLGTSRDETEPKPVEHHIKPASRDPTEVRQRLKNKLEAMKKKTE